LPPQLPAIAASITGDCRLNYRRLPPELSAIEIAATSSKARLRGAVRQSAKANFAFVGADLSAFSGNMQSPFLMFWLRGVPWLVRLRFNHISGVIR
jgi:hypothetical protein